MEVQKKKDDVDSVDAQVCSPPVLEDYKYGIYRILSSGPFTVISYALAKFLHLDKAIWSF